MNKNFFNQSIQLAKMAAAMEDPRLTGPESGMASLAALGTSLGISAPGAGASIYGAEKLRQSGMNDLQNLLQAQLRASQTMRQVGGVASSSATPLKGMAGILQALNNRTPIIDDGTGKDLVAGLRRSSKLKGLGSIAALIGGLGGSVALGNMAGNHVGNSVASNYLKYKPNTA